MCQDLYLRQQTDSQGWIPISTIALFNPLRKLTTDFNLVRDTMHMSSLVEISPDGEKARMSHGGWAQFVLPGAQSGDAQVGSSSAQGVPAVQTTGELGLGLVGVEQTQAEQPE